MFIELVAKAAKYSNQHSTHNLHDKLIVSAITTLLTVISYRVDIKKNRRNMMNSWVKTCFQDQDRWKTTPMYRSNNCNRNFRFRASPATAPRGFLGRRSARPLWAARLQLLDVLTDAFCQFPWYSSCSNMYSVYIWHRTDIYFSVLLTELGYIPDYYVYMSLSYETGLRTEL